jgi:hypothetical protein
MSGMSLQIGFVIILSQGRPTLRYFLRPGRTGFKDIQTRLDIDASSRIIKSSNEFYNGGGGISAGADQWWWILHLLVVGLHSHPCSIQRLCRMK